MTHTPGPWSISDWRHINNETGQKYIADARGGVICETYRGRGEHEMLANARLIAAAPELLAALENLLTYDRVERPAFRAKPEGAPNSSVRIRQEKLIALEDQAAAVLAKSKGTAP